MSRYVVSLGGNALGNNAEEQKQLLVGVAKSIVHLIKLGNEVIIVHGNGPQVGMINLAFTESTSAPDMPFPECGAMSQGYIGFHIQNAIYNALKEEGLKRNVATVVSQVLVDKNDPMFQNPTKPVGAFYSEADAKKLAAEKGYSIKEDAGRGWRRVVASPLPIDVIEKESIARLVKAGDIVICAGGGGIPVIENNGKLEGVAAVIDKDYASAKVAELVDADYLVILTAVDNVYINFNKPDQKKLEKVSKAEMEEYLKTDYFAKGSMYPKVNACVKFLTKAPGKTAIISSLAKAPEAFELRSGTIIK
ncbi:MAG: carbamate kinase [Firmicutes bacterium]|nr:carbamate kinase [Candidatus Fiminaster equi]